ncbi:MAG TPA: hypothetical protein VLH56_08620 [Dissulfurispiraceae bacterium]|nr:hypothetical protein [Dissulfurispiraceae bacterium]
MIIGIDPGAEKSAVVIYQHDYKQILHAMILSNAELVREIASIDLPYHTAPTVVIEWINNMGLPVGNSVFETCRQIGRMEAAFIREGWRVELLSRNAIRMQLCGRTAGVNDAVIAQAVINRFGEDRQQAVGTKKNPGPLYGIKRDLWQALAVAIAWAEEEEK